MQDFLNGEIYTQIVWKFSDSSVTMMHTSDPLSN